MLDTINFKLYSFVREDIKDLMINQREENNDFEVILFENANGTIVIDFNEYEITGNVAYFINPKAVYTLSVIDFSKCWVLKIDLKYLGLFLINYQIIFCPFSTSPYTYLTWDQYMSLDTILTSIKDELVNSHVKRIETINLLTNLLFIQIERLRLVAQDQPSKSNHLTLFYSLLEEYFIADKEVSTYASKLKITPKQLNRLCLANLKKNASQLIAERVNLEAMRLLFSSDLTVKEIAFTLGFDDPSYFNRYFKRINNTTPQDFKIAMSDKYHKKVV